MTAEAPRKPVIGVVGGVGAGKTTAAAEFEALGCVRVDADAIGHELLGEEAVRRAIRRRWGSDVFLPDGAVDREALAEVVFANPAELAALNDLLHPRIGRRIAEAIDRAAADPAVPGVVVDAALLFEAGWDGLCTHVVFVEADPAQRAQRARRSAAARSWSDEQWRLRENSQISLDRKRARCWDVLDNSSGISYLRKQVRRVFERLARQAGRLQ